MPKEDYLQKYLEKLSRVIAAMTGLRETGYPDDALCLSDEAYRELFRLNTGDLAAMTVDDFIGHIVAIGYTATSIESIAALTYETACVYDFQENADFARSFYLKSLHLYLFLREKDKTFSFDREMRISELKNRI